MQNLCPRFKSTSFVSFYETNEQIVKVFEGVGSLGAIYLSNTENARDLEMLQEREIKAIISAQEGEQINHPSNFIPEYLYLPIKDDIDFNIAAFFSESFGFIEKNRRETNLLIHCSQGISCSIAIVISYLIQKYEYTYIQSYDLIAKRYPPLKEFPFNVGFVHRLQYLAVTKGDFKMVDDNHLRRRIERVRRCYGGIARSYSKELSVNQKLEGRSPGKGSSIKGSCRMIPFEPKSLTKFSSTNISLKNPEVSRELDPDYSKFLPKKTAEEQQDEEHHKKITAEIFQLSEQNKIYLSKRMVGVRSRDSAANNYNRLLNAKKEHKNFYSPLKKMQKYTMFTTKRLNVEFEHLQAKASS